MKFNSWKVNEHEANLATLTIFFFNLVLFLVVGTCHWLRVHLTNEQSLYLRLYFHELLVANLIHEIF